MKRSPFALGYRLLAIAALAIAALLQPCCSRAADFYTVLTVTVTNQVNGIATNGTDTLTVNADTRTATNNIASDPGKLWLGTNAQLRATTNLYTHLALYPFGLASTRLQLQWMNTNQFRLIGQVNQAVAGSAGGVWGTVMSTNYPITNRTTMFSPSTGASLITQTNFGNAIADYLNVAETFLSQTAAGLSNFLSLAQAQTASNKTFRVSQLEGGRIVNATNLTGANVALTNVTLVTFVLVGGSASNLTALEGIVSRLADGYWTNAILDRGSFSNSVFYSSNTFAGASIDLSGSGVNNFVSMTSTSTIAAISPILIFQRQDGITGDVDTDDLLGNIVFAGYGTTGHTVGARIRAYAEETFTDSTGASSLRFETTPSGASATVVRMRIEPDGTVRILGTNTVAYQISTNLVALSGFFSNMLFAAINGTNFQARDATFTGTNQVNGDLSFARFSNTTIVNGNNAGILIGTNVIVELSGGTTIAQYAGFTASRDGDTRLVRMSGPITNIIVNEVDATWSTDGTAARRIVTGTGASLSLTNSPSWMQMVYRAASSRWEVLSHSR